MKTNKELSHIIQWGPCAVEFDFEPESSGYSSMNEMYFEPGFYMFNNHTILNWKTMTPVFDFVYLIKAVDFRCKEDGTPKFPELFRMCDKGVVVRKLCLLDEDGNERFSYRNYDNNVFVVAAPSGVTINGEEFHFKG